MLRFNNISLRRGVRLLFEGVTLTIYPGYKVGVTGANGTGKSSLFSMIRNELHADVGELQTPSGWVIAHVAQEVGATSVPAVEYVLDGDHELRQLQSQLAKAEQADDGHLQAELHGRLDAIGAYTARARALRLMHGLGFVSGQEERPVTEFSGGWRMRLNLAQALMCRSDLLLLDEPTNHLDLDAVIWLQDWLRNYPGTLLLISHDRDFLDEITGHIVHLEQQGITLYSGNYSAFEGLRAARLANQQSAYEKQQRERAHMQSFVERFRAKATKARQAQSRLKALARMEEIAPAHVDSQFHFHFRAAEKMPSPLLHIDEVTAGYGDTTILRKVSINLVPGARIGLLGHNGAGKSTLIKLMAGELLPKLGERVEAKELRIGYFAQHQLEQLSEDGTPMSHLQAIDPRATEKELRSYLGGFGFSGDMALASVALFSGGEKARLVLALLIYQRPNLLLLDEPTNHLDLEMRHALSMALQEYEGAMVVVSHDRYLLRSVTDTLMLVDHGVAVPFDGDLDDYRKWLMEGARETVGGEGEESASGDNSATARKERRRLEAEQRKKVQPLRNKVQKLEKVIDHLHTEKQELEQLLSDPQVYEEVNKAHLMQLMARQSEVVKSLELQEQEWLELSETLEALE
jgi:ATP-binding cassette subfamily F protein 3